MSAFELSEWLLECVNMIKANTYLEICKCQFYVLNVSVHHIFCTSVSDCFLLFVPVQFTLSLNASVFHVDFSYLHARALFSVTFSLVFAVRYMFCKAQTEAVNLL